MPSSLNFAFPDVPPAVDTLGASAERLIYVDPDLALVRIRQLLEVFVAHVSEQGPAVEATDEHNLGSVLSALLPTHVRGISHGTLRTIARACNEAVHHKVGHRATDAFAKVARDQIQAIHRVWTTWLGQTVPFRWPDAGSTVATTVAERHVALDRIEHQVDVVRSDRAVEEIDRLPKLPVGVTAKDLALLRLRETSIRRASDNHQGLPPVPADPLALEVL